MAKARAPAVPLDGENPRRTPSRVRALALGVDVAGGLPGLSAASEDVLRIVEVEASTRFAAGSRRELLRDFHWGLSWAERTYDARKGPYENFALSLWLKLVKEHEKKWGGKRLKATYQDEVERDAATSDGAACTIYYSKWRRRLEKLMLAHAGRWRVIGLAQDEVIDELSVGLLEAVKSRQFFDAFQKPGCEWTLLFLAKSKDRLRARRRVYVVPRNKDVGIISEMPLTRENLLLAAQVGAVSEKARVAVEESLSKPQLRWLSALKMALHRGDGVFANGGINTQRSRASSERIGRQRRAPFASCRSSSRTPAARLWVSKAMMPVTGQRRV